MHGRDDIIVRSTFPPNMARIVDKIAADHEMTRSQLIRLSVKKYLHNELGIDVDQMSSKDMAGEHKLLGSAV
jgi:metal-responsive CopG/Arc/MetJ family transcriptional regulator